MKRKSYLIIACCMHISTTIIAQSWTTGGNTLGSTGTFGSIDNKNIDFISHNKKQGRLTNEGLWGFGTTSPLAQVHINSTDATRNPLQVDVLDATKMVVTNSGNAGIGTTSPLAQVHINSTDANRNPLQVDVLNAAKMVVTNSGNVGIGTTSPLVPLHIMNGGGATLVGGGYVEIGTPTATNLGIDNDEIMARNNGAASTLSLNRLGGDVNIHSGALFFQSSTNRLGIGTAAPAVPLNVVGGSALSLSGGGTIVVGATNTFNLGISTGSIQARNNAAGGLLSLNADGGDVNISRGALFVEAATNNIGIGAVPSAKFHVVIGSAATLSGGGYIVAGPTTFENLVIDANGIQARNNGRAEILNLNPQGERTIVGDILQVNGNIVMAGGGAFVGGGFATTRSSGDFIPDIDAFYLLGNSSKRWAEVWADDGSVNTSDARDKKNIRDLNYGLKKIMQLHPVKFNWKDEHNTDDKLGLIAQDLQKVLPEVVKAYEYKRDSTGKREKVAAARLGVMYADIIPVLIKGIQEQQQMIEQQNKKNEELQRMITDQNKNIEALKQLMNTLKDDLSLTKALNENTVKSAETITGASLAQNSPNPFNQSTVINYLLPQNTANAFIRITDVNGRLIKNIAATAKGKGQVILQAGELAAGIYQYSLVVNGKLIDTKKMVLTK
ncbi:MAG TPA: tail fiber domain-containing protein [Chitinophagaceae bacterium]